MKLDWKNIIGAAFFVATLFGSGLARANELPMSAANQNAVCSCARSQFNAPNCQIIKEQNFGPGALGTGAQQHAATGPAAAMIQAQANARLGAGVQAN